jgi:hypothetical protein
MRHKAKVMNSPILTKITARFWGLPIWTWYLFVVLSTTLALVHVAASLPVA